MLAFKEQLVQWAQAAESWDSQDFERALQEFLNFADFSKIHFNVGMCFIRMNNIAEAVAAFARAIACDEYLSLAYMQRGICLYQLKMFDDALSDFQMAFKTLRGNYFIDYTQLGMPHQVFACHVIFNIALCHIQLDDPDRGLRYIEEARKAIPPEGSKYSPDVSDIEEAARVGTGAIQVCLPYEVPADLIFRPQEENVKNTRKVDYLGQSKVVAGVDSADNYTGFSGNPPAAALASDRLGLSGATHSSKEYAELEANISLLVEMQPGIATNGQSAQPRSRSRSQQRQRQQQFDELEDRMASVSVKNRETVIGPLPGAISRQGTISSLNSNSGDTIKVKCHYTESRIIIVHNTISFLDLQARVMTKFGTEVPLNLKFKDANGQMIVMSNDDDLENAISSSPVGRLEIWCFVLA
eukprot:jgi/Hompol1/4584/HPOL_001906-RA